MKVNVISGDDAVFRAVAFGTPDREVVRRSYERLQSFSRVVTDKARGLLDRTKEVLDSIYDPEVARIAKRIGRHRRGTFRENSIQFLDNQEEIANAPEKMRRYILANVRIKRLIDNQRIDGYGYRKTDADMEGWGSTDRYYVSATNGVAKECPDTGKWVTEYQYGACDIDGEVLDVSDQLDVLATWDIANQILDDGIDPTSKLAEKLIG